ncbi:unnamed protein product [Allacma fusca]|uniref:Uncharacterized protein n=1 Tax=Allacma fusca TaxID=39272 RepID=A0A8J2NNF7_9HEXA|nr:unnamed protein product [Allacma fusca]
MERSSSVEPQSPRQKFLETFALENAAQQNPKIIITPDMAEGDPGYLPEISLKLIQEWIGKHTIEVALKQYKTQVSRLVSTNSPFTEKYQKTSMRKSCKKSSPCSIVPTNKKYLPILH